MTDNWQSLGSVTARIVERLRPTETFSVPLQGTLADAVRREAAKSGNKPETIIAEAESQGVLESEERSMISGVMRFADRSARGLMTPRLDVEMVDLVERGQRHAAARRIEARRLGGRHADHFQPGGDALAEQLDEMLGGRAGAEPELHAVAHLLEGTRRSLPLQLVHVHVCACLVKISKCGRFRPLSAAYVASFFPGEQGLEQDLGTGL